MKLRTWAALRERSYLSETADTWLNQGMMSEHKALAKNVSEKLMKDGGIEEVYAFCVELLEKSRAPKEASAVNGVLMKFSK